MANCFRCGISDEAELLFDAVSNRGVVKLCKNCTEKEDFPLIGKNYEDKPEKTKTVYERLSQMANLDPEKHKNFIKNREETIKRQRQDKTLKDIVDERFTQRIVGKSKPRTDLIDNFHWIIMRFRRAKKLSQKQLAENIDEPELAVKMAEEGYIADNSDSLVRKLENYFKIKLFRDGSFGSLSQPVLVRTGIRQTFVPEDPVKQKIKEDFEKQANFDINTSKALTIADLQEIKKKKESKEGIFSFFRRKKEEKNTTDEKELSDEEAEEILFGEK